MDHTPIPVIAVPEAADFLGLSSILYMTNFDPSDPLAISGIDALFHPLIFQIQCIHISTSKSEVIARENIEKLTRKDLPIRRETSISFQVITGQDPQETLGAFLEDFPTDLIAFIPHKRNFFRNLSRQSLTKEDLFLTRIPILAIPSRY
jgi:hypothetical protein